jgi:hypothetical protein
MVADQLWKAAGMAPHGGMLCLVCLERRIGRPLVVEDFTALMPSKEAWRRHLAYQAEREKEKECTCPVCSGEGEINPLNPLTPEDSQ